MRRILSLPPSSIDECFDFVNENYPYSLIINKIIEEIKFTVKDFLDRNLCEECKKRINLR